jgi:hypothetical protein
MILGYAQIVEALLDLYQWGKVRENLKFFPWNSQIGDLAIMHEETFNLLNEC